MLQDDRLKDFWRCSLAMLLAVAVQSPAMAQQTWTQVPEVAPSVNPDEVKGTKQETLIPEREWNRGPKPNWIWGSDNDARYRMAVEFDAKTQRGVLRASCDNVMTIYLNGQRLASSDSWQETTEVNVNKHLALGKNLLEVEVSNQGGIAGLVLKLGLVDNSGRVEWIVSDDSWLATDIKTKQTSDIQVVGKLGDGPWGQALSQVAQPGAVPRDVFVTRPGFQVEKMFTVPRDELGSWVAITFDPQGRLIASDQGDKGLFRITLPVPGSDGETIVEKLNLPITAAQGLLFAFDSLYISVNGGTGSGLYRATDSDKDGELDTVAKLKEFRGGGEHGPHALRLAPDGKSIFVICGNHTDPPADFDSSRLPANWDEDLLLPRQWDANGHARGRMAPGGWIAKTDSDGKQWEMISVGYRNPYDMDFNAEGELFAYDADMEWDLGSPWYRPTRVVHATSGSEFGWRSGTGKWPTYYEDSLPPLVNIGPGSPVGVEFGYGAKFPAEYQKALYICDWTFGTMYAIHMVPDGASYKAEKEEFVSRTPLPLTDVAISPDGAMYFTVGGRGTQSELYRVTYVGDAATTKVDATESAGSELRAARREFETYHGVDIAADPAKLDKVWAGLGHEDRFLRYAARVALEAQPLDAWRAKLAKESNPTTLIAATVALARQGQASDLQLALDALGKGNFAKLDLHQQLAWSRALQLVFIRLGEPDEATKQTWATMLDPAFPAESDDVNRELVQLLVYLDSPEVVGETLALLQTPSRQQQDDLTELIARNRGYGGAIAAMMANQPDAQQIHYAFVLRNAKAGWNIPHREAYFRWFDKARTWAGGASYQGFLTNIDSEAFDGATEAERLAVEALGARKPFVMATRPDPIGPGREWSVDVILKASGEKLTGRNYENGKRAFAAASCILCHRFAGEGGATGPDLTQAAGRFGIKEMAEAIVLPDLAISDQYRASRILTVSGQVLIGKVVSENATHYVVLTDPQDSSKVVELAKDDVEQMDASPTSMMPAKLLDPLNQDEVLDMVAYLLSRGNARDPMFRGK